MYATAYTSKSIVYLFSLVYMWLTALAVSTFSHRLYIVCSICPPFSIPMSRVNATASQHYHQSKSILCSIPKCNNFFQLQKLIKSFDH